MDEVLDKLETTVITQNVADTEDNKSNFEGLYKNWGKLGSQEERRHEILELQKTNRHNKLDRFRGIFELVKAVEEKDYNLFRSRHAYYRPNIYVAGFNKAPSYSNVLMLSEWMIEKPLDFIENWYAVPCPKGVRMLVVATKGRTKFYTKYGGFVFECRSALPGGSPTDQKARQNCCVIDGFYDKHTNTMFILDLLAWNSQPMTDGETEFRHFWLESHLSDNEDLKKINKKNEVIFSILPKVPCDSDSLSKLLLKYPHFEENSPMVDGLLFYHKRAHYFNGETPLVGWLFPFMVPEVLGEDIKINAAYEIQRPIDYVNQADYITKFELSMRKKKDKRGSRRNSRMDTTEPETEKTTKAKTVKNKKDKNDSQKMDSDSTEDKKEDSMDADVIEDKKETEVDKKEESMEAEVIEDKKETKVDKREESMESEILGDKKETKEDKTKESVESEVLGDKKDTKVDKTEESMESEVIEDKKDTEVEEKEESMESEVIEEKKESVEST